MLVFNKISEPNNEFQSKERQKYILYHMIPSQIENKHDLSIVSKTKINKFLKLNKNLMNGLNEISESNNEVDVIGNYYFN